MSENSPNKANIPGISGFFDSPNIGDIVKKTKYDIGMVNILILGQAGVGKSTLINAVFQGDFAATGQGRPVTTTIREYSKEGIPLTIFDTPGLELGKYDQAVKELGKLIEERIHSTDPNQHIHIAWYCIHEGSSRVLEAEKNLVKMLAEHHIPTVAVITKARSDSGFMDIVQKELPEASNVIRVHALPIKRQDGTIIPPIGLEKLVTLSNDLVPEAIRNALAASVRDLALKQRRARETVMAAAATAAGIGAIPIPFADAALLIPLHISMLARISAIYNLPLNEAYIGTLVGGTVASAGGTFLGRVAVTNLIKLIPGAGSIVSGAINAAVASGITTSLGKAYIGALTHLISKSKDGKIKAEELHTALQEQLHQSQ